MLTAAGAAHGQGAQHHPLVEPPRFLELRRLRRIEHVDQMKVAVAGMADEADRERRALTFLLGLDDAFGEANPSSCVMSGCVDVLDEAQRQTEADKLDEFV